MGRVAADLTGKKFGKWTVMKRAGRSKQGALWECLCECGNINKVRGTYLHNGESKSCGCCRAESARKHGHNTTKGKSKTYSSWESMIQRCTNPNNKHFNRYGGRGITICESWRDFPNFLADMGERPDGLSLDRINNNRGYSPDNCRWATDSQQNNNRANSRFVTVNGYTDTIPNHARRYNINVKSARNRIYLGWSPMDTFMIPIKKTAQLWSWHQVKAGRN